MGVVGMEGGGRRQSRDGERRARPGRQRREARRGRDGCGGRRVVAEWRQREARRGRGDGGEWCAGAGRAVSGRHTGARGWRWVGVEPHGGGDFWIGVGGG